MPRGVGLEGQSKAIRITVGIKKKHKYMTSEINLEEFVIRLGKMVITFGNVYLV